MPEQAIVTSVDALRAFRSNLIIYVSKARPALEEVTSDVMRTRSWLETDRRVFWEAEIRRRTRRLEAAQQALFGVSLSNLRDATMSEKAAVRKAKEAMDEAELKLKSVKRWIRELETKLEPLVRQLEKLHTILSSDMTNAIVYLAEASRTLDAYAEIAPSETTGSPVTAATPSGETTEGVK
jgi:chromosome segregation ATPase